MRIDAHHHLWRYDPAAFGWIDPASAIARSFDADDLRQLLTAHRIDGAIAVQARQVLEETRFLIEAAGTSPIVGVVGWIDLRSERIVELLAGDAHPLIVGYRHVVQDEADDEFLLQDSFVRGVRAVLDRDLSYDLLVNGRQLGHVPAFLDRTGQGRYILDHIAKPDIRGGGWQPWADQMRAVADCPWVMCKVSGMVTEADHANWSPSDFERYLDHVFAIFGVDRLIWGSDWPVCLLAAEYGAVLKLVEDYVARNCPEAASAIFGDNAVRAYALKPTKELV